MTAQVVRLSSRNAGRRILDEVGLAPRIREEQRTTLSWETRATYVVGLFPRNVDLQDNEGRRKTHTQAFLKKVQNGMNSVVFVHEAQYKNNMVFTLSLRRGALCSCASARAATPGMSKLWLRWLCQTQNDPTFTPTRGSQSELSNLATSL